MKGSDLKFDARMDFDGDGQIAFGDFLQFIEFFGRATSEVKEGGVVYSRALFMVCVFLMSFLLLGGEDAALAVEAVPDTVYVGQNSRANIDVLANDGLGTSAFVVSLSPADFGERVVLNSDGSVHYRPLPDFLGVDGFIYSLDAGGQRVDGRVVIYVRVFEEMLNARPDSVILAIGQGKVLDVLANDSYLGTRIISVAGVTEQRFDAHAFPLLDGRIYYRPSPDFRGTDRFFYIWADDLDHRVRVEVTAIVDGALRLDIAVDDEVDMVENTVLRHSVLNNDRLGNTVGHVSVSSAWHGIAHWDVEARQIEYVPIEGYTGSDQVVYTLSDDRGNQTSAVLRVRVNPFNAAPEAVADSIAVASGRGVIIYVLHNDKDVEGDALSLVSVGQSEQGGQVLQNADGSVFYRSPGDFVGNDQFEYEMEDASGQSGQSVVTIAVGDDVTTPQALDDEVFVSAGDRVNISVLENDTFLGDTIAVVWATSGRYSDLVIVNSDQKVHYRAGAGYIGSDFFAYTIQDRQLKTASALVRLRSPAGLSGDFDGDDHVGFGDFLMFVVRFGLDQSSLDFDGRMDFDGDGKIAFGDFVSFSSFFGNLVTGG